MKKNLITTALLLSASSFVQAEEKTELPAINVYSAYATPVNQDQTASSVTVLTEKDFAERNASYVLDSLKTTPSVSFSATGGRGALSNLYLRGSKSNHVLVVVDGVKRSPLDGYGFDFGSLNLSDIERIEILRGEQSALWGSDAMGGVIYITTKSGMLKEKPFNIDFDFGTGSHKTRDGSVTLSGYENGFYYSLHGDSHRTRGFSSMSQDKFTYTGLDNQTVKDASGNTVVSGGANEKDGFHRDNASLRFGYADENKGLEFLTSHSSQTGYYDNSIFDEKGYRLRYRETVFKLGGFLGNEKELLKHSFNINHLKADSDRYGPNSWDRIYYQGKRFNANYQLDINLDREGPITQAFSLLTDYQKSYYNSSAFTNTFTGVIAGEKKLIEKSVAMEYRLLSEEDHSLSVSGRYTNSSKFDNRFTGRIAGTYRLSPNFRAHTSFGSAVKNPSITEYYGYDAQFVANNALKPESSRGGDIGLIMETTDKQHSLDITYFGRLVEDFISSTRNGGVSYAINLPGKTRIKGIEVAYKGQLTNDINTYANYTYTNTRQSNGNEITRLPKHMANAGIGYQITEKLGTNANISYVGKRRDTYFAPDWRSYNVKLPSYTLFNLGASYQLTQNLNIYVNLNNLFDKKYEHTAGYEQDGRNVYIGLKGSF